jgi:alkylhydroperoxidase family enzyme
MRLQNVRWNQTRLFYRRESEEKKESATTSSEAIDGFRESDLFTPAEKAALRYAEEMSRTPVDVPDDLFDELRRHFDDRGIVELTAMIAFENTRARFNRAPHIESDRLCMLPDNDGAKSSKKP